MFDIAIEPREDSPEKLMSQKRRPDLQLLDTSALSAVELRVLRELLADGYYESEEVTNVIAKALRKLQLTP
jgi:hypothetical protein